MEYKYIKRRNWYILSLSLPVLIPLAFVMAGSKDTALLIFQLSAIPYLFFYLCTLWWGRNKSADEMFQVSWILPVIFALFLAGGLFLLEMLTKGASSGILEITGVIFMCALVTGYGYVLLTHSITCCLRWAGILKE